MPGTYRLAVLLVGAVMAATVGCGGEQRAADLSSAGDGTTTAPAEVPTTDPLDLIGLWRVTPAAGASGAVLRIAGPEMRLWQGCRELGADWEADTAGTFVAYAHFSTGRCPERYRIQTPRWLAAATSFAGEADRVELRNARGNVTAVLTPATAADLRLGTRRANIRPPLVTKEIRRRLSNPVPPLPLGLRPASSDEILGHVWFPVGWTGRAAGTPYTQFHVDRSLTGSDGCNFQSGRYTLGAGGQLVAATGFQTAVGCDGTNVGGWVMQATRAAFDGPVLVLVDDNGKPLARLRAEPTG